MPIIDSIKDLARKAIPQKFAPSISAVASSSAHGGLAFDNEMPISKPSIVFHSLQGFFAFVAMCCFASVASFQAKHVGGPSGLSGFAIFCGVSNLFLALFLVLIPVLFEKYSKFAALARALKELRVAFILVGTGLGEVLLIALISTISAWTQPGCKDPKKDPNAEKGGDSFVNGLPDWCRTKKAGSIFFWLATAAWTASFVLIVLDWRSGKDVGGTRARDPPFRRPTHDDAESMVSRHPTRLRRDGDDDFDAADHEDDGLQSPFADPRNRPYGYAPPAARQSMDAYGAFNVDDAPSGYTNPYAPHPASPPRFQSSISPNPSPGVSRTMALAYEDTGATTGAPYQDPYERVQQSVVARSGAPPGYDYR